MTFPALPHVVDKHLVAGMRALYEAAEHFRQVPLDKLDPTNQFTIREAIGHVDAIKDVLFLLRMGRERTDDTPPVDLVGATSMAGPRTRPFTRRVYELLADGEWHPMEAVIREAAKEVLPGEAHRHMEDARKQRTPTREERARQTDDIKIVERGQASVVVNAISGNDRIEYDPPRSVKVPRSERKLRLRPPNIYGNRNPPKNDEAGERSGVEVE